MRGLQAERFPGTGRKRRLPRKDDREDGGRKGKGRMYVPIFNKSESDIEKDGSILTGNLATLQGYWGGAFTALAASDVKPALLHSDGSTPDLITAWTVKPLIATQRRRLRR